ncbi:hypothetical protein P700755_002182 [Psychroflexus torquis ATCC 700755]|uniref:Uncharacterized protein n=1 Tax=Psychroflexus torquis (strain ATCC 700755 / CIP 106069 / ACAM 623) TaxID=313595 RepID=K4IEL4_PSYTT|nr:hypothetical protein [Psychroflexus torquis]AFU68972.1 hypothetical protein P700755_002182 [Psychroflexus torquis ATCC 700755]
MAELWEANSRELLLISRKKDKWYGRVKFIFGVCDFETNADSVPFCASD